MSEKQRMLELVETDKAGDEWVVCKAAFHAILTGEAIDRTGLVVATGFAPEKVSTLLNKLNEQGLIVVEPDSGRVVGSWGLSSVPTDHRLRIRGRALHTWCALDAVGIPAAGALAVGMPAVEVPAVGIPAAGAPAVGLPAVSVPAVGIPATGAPAVGLPAVNAPAVGRATIV